MLYAEYIYVWILVLFNNISNLTYKGKPAGDQVCLGDIKIKENAKIMMMGTCEAIIVSEPKSSPI